MNHAQLLEHFLAFGKNNGLEVAPGEMPGQARFGIEHLGITARGTVVCEEDPVSLQIICRLPVKTLAQHRTKMVQLLNGLNLRTRFGSFQFDPEDGEVVFRSGLPVHEEVSVPGQIAFAFGMVVASFGQAARRLAAFATVGGEVGPALRAMVESSDPDASTPVPRRPSRKRSPGARRPSGLN